MEIRFGKYCLSMTKCDEYQKGRRERRDVANISIAAANSLLQKSFADNKYISPLKLQKLLYFVHKEYLKKTDGATLITEQFDAWDYGPVLPAVYHAFKPFGSRSITSLMSEDGEEYVISKKNEAFREALESVWDRYSDLTAQKLVDVTHVAGGAWESARAEGTLIDNEKIFKEKDWY